MIRWQRCRIRIQVRSNSPGDGDTNTQTQRSAVTQLCVGVCDHARRAQPCSSSCVHRGALKYWTQKDGTVWAWWDFSASQSFWLWGIELQSTQQCPEQQGYAGPVSNTSQLLQTPLQVPSLLQELPFHTSVHFQPHYVLWSTPCPSSLSLLARATAEGGFPVCIFTFVPCFTPQMRTPTLTQTEEPNTNRAWREDDQALSSLLNALPIETSSHFSPFPPHSLWNHQSTDRAVMWKRRLFPVPWNTPWHPTVDLAKQHSSILCCPSALSTSMSWVNGSSIFNIYSFECAFIIPNL